MKEEFLMMYWCLRVWAHDESHRRIKNERGSYSLEMVLIAFGVATLAGAVYLIVRTKVLAKASAIPTN